MENFVDKGVKDGENRVQNENDRIQTTNKKVANPKKFKYQCEKCPLRTDAKKVFENHQIHHNRYGNPSYPCNCKYCDASFENGNGLARHANLHKDKTEQRAKEVPLAVQTRKSPRTPKSTAPFIAANRTASSNVDRGQSNNNGPVGNSNGGTKRTHPREDETDKDDNRKQMCKQSDDSLRRRARIIGFGGNGVQRASRNEIFENGLTPTVPNEVAENAADASALAIYMDEAVNSVTKLTNSFKVSINGIKLNVKSGEIEIGPISCQFHCNKCLKGVVRCYKGFGLCIHCCDHPLCR